MTRTERTRLAMSDWRFWVGVAYFGLVLVVVALYFVNNRTSRANATVARESAVHQAEIVAARRSREIERRVKVTQCLAGRPQGMKINRFLRGVQEFHQIIAQNSKAVLDATPKSDPQYQVRLRNYRRVVRTVADVSGVRFTVPTVADCKKLGNP